MNCLYEMESNSIKNKSQTQKRQQLMNKGLKRTAAVYTKMRER